MNKNETTMTEEERLSQKRAIRNIYAATDRERHRERINKYQSEWQKKNKEKVREMQRRCRQKKAEEKKLKKIEEESNQTK